MGRNCWHHGHQSGQQLSLPGGVHSMDAPDPKILGRLKHIIDYYYVETYTFFLLVFGQGYMLVLCEFWSNLSGYLYSALYIIIYHLLVSLSRQDILRK